MSQVNGGRNATTANIAKTNRTGNVTTAGSVPTKGQLGVRDRVKEIAEAQRWANERRDEIIAVLKEDYGLSDQFLREMFTRWGLHHGR